MSFPKLESHTHPLILPTSKKKIRYRGWCVKEENALLIAKKTGTKKAHGEAISNIVRLVTNGTVDPKREAVVDVLYVFLLSRARGVGEQSIVTVECPKCESDVSAIVDLSKIEVEINERNPVVKLGKLEDGEGELTVEFNELSFEDFIAAQDSDEPDLEIFKRTVKKISSDEEVYEHSTASDADWRQLYESIPSNKLGDVTAFFESRPTAVAHAIGKCKCGEKIDQELRRISDFL